MYKIEKSVFIRKENKQGDEIYLVYVGVSNRMFEINVDAYKCLSIVMECDSEEDCVVKLIDLFPDTDINVLVTRFRECLEFFLTIGVLQVTR